MTNCVGYPKCRKALSIIINFSDFYVYQPTHFVIWGGNQPALGDAVKVGNDYMFWGAQWDKQEKAGDCDGKASFKGFADNVNASNLTFTTDPGNSPDPPDTIASYISVIVSISIDKKGNTISGNIAELAILRVDNSSTYDITPDTQEPGWWWPFYRHLNYQGRIRTVVMPRPP